MSQPDSPVDPDVIDPVTGLDDLDVRRMQPYQARKEYLCPGCNQPIAPGTGHTVVIPRAAADLRRHWHHPCWQRRDRRPSATTKGRAR